MKDFKKRRAYKKIMKVVDRNRLVSDRASELKGMGYSVEEIAMGSGGVGNVKETQSEYRVQIGYGKGKWNYASTVVIKK